MESGRDVGNGVIVEKYNGTHLKDTRRDDAEYSKEGRLLGE